MTLSPEHRIPTQEIKMVVVHQRDETCLRLLITLCGSDSWIQRYGFKPLLSTLFSLHLLLHVFFFSLVIALLPMFYVHFMPYDIIIIAGSILL